jgi:N,N'-diacetyllegionaminate synthase
MRQKVLIIAEAGVNHNGDINVAKELIRAAATACVDYVKFQTFRADKLVSKTAKQAEYQKKNIGDGGDSQYNMLKKLELSHENHLELIAFAKEKGVEFFSTAFDVDGLDYLNSLDFKLFKLPSGEITNYPYLRRLSELGKPVILSTGMADLVEINAAMDVLTAGSLTKDDITVLHCNTEYPTPMGDVNLLAMNTIGKELGVKIGYSDHTLGIEVPTAAVALGATVIEKHFTLDRNLPGPDHKASLEPNELKAMVKAIRNIEAAISGNGIKTPSQSELGNRIVGRKSIFIKKNLPKGFKITENDLISLRPGDGISPMMWNEIIGRTTRYMIPEYAKLDIKDIE